MYHSVTNTFEYSVDDIKNLIKADMLKRMPHITTLEGMQIKFDISSVPGYDGPGMAPQVLNKVVGSFTNSSVQKR